MLNSLNVKNGYKILSINDDLFQKYGRILDLDLSATINEMKAKSIPSEKNIYVASDFDLENTADFALLKNCIYGGLDIQIGYCNGNSFKMNALEYHIGSEVNVAITDLVLFLATQNDVENHCIDTKKVQAFFVPAGTILELNQGILHFAPCKVQDAGFKCVVVLLKGTNEEIDFNVESGVDSQYLFKKNKWIYVHEQREDLVALGAKIGLDGVNFEVKY